MLHNEKWNNRFMQLAKTISDWSKDPSTKVGAVIVRPNKSIASIGFNGFPQGVEDTEERYNDRNTKLDLVVHAEANAIAFCPDPRPLKRYTLYVWPFAPCTRCAGLIIQSEITTVVSPPLKDLPDRWLPQMQLSLKIFEEAGVKFHEHYLT